MSAMLSSRTVALAAAGTVLVAVAACAPQDDDVST
ncbi:amino acid ABC transporter substrate-binding protein, partial [Micromonospora sp. KC207]